MNLLNYARIRRQINEANWRINERFCKSFSMVLALSANTLTFYLSKLYYSYRVSRKFAKSSLLAEFKIKRMAITRWSGEISIKYVFMYNKL